MKKTNEGEKVASATQYEIERFTRLGKEIKISPKANITVNKVGFKTEFFCETVQIIIGIGKNHTASLIMSKDSWEALNTGAKVHIETTEDYKKKYVYKK